MTPHWPSPLVAWILAGCTGAVFVGTAVWWWLCRVTRDVRAAEDAWWEAHKEDDDLEPWQAAAAEEWVAKYAPMIRRGEYVRLPSRSGVNAMFDPGKETRP